jgi:hypothetical protein
MQSVFFKGKIIMKAKNEKKALNEEKVLLTFLKRTRDGKYAKIDKESLDHPRVDDLREESYQDDEYYYSIR